MSDEPNLYDQDFSAGTQGNAALLPAGRIVEADCEHLAEVWSRARRQARDALLDFDERVQTPEASTYSSEQALEDGFVPGRPPHLD